ncbi:MAG: hypothetical protein OHK93_005003 [Ramalina farinacea]|uniref:Uncharacterized protein n=1 Tax=Ramalina farinacea TaxID=258253 RepID=A0AA43U0V3_9LECA|nr:hypothetical protein [Ramalina farinacea]
MHIPTPLRFLPIFLPTLTSALSLPTNSSTSLLPPLLPPIPNNLTTDLSTLGPSCFDASKRTLAPVSLDSCLDAITRVGTTLPPSIYLLPRLFKTQAADVPGGTKVPISWRASGCMVEINSARGQVGLAEAAEFSLIGAAYFARYVETVAD